MIQIRYNHTNNSSTHQVALPSHQVALPSWQLDYCGLQYNTICFSQERLLVRYGRNKTGCHQIVTMLVDHLHSSDQIYSHL